MNKIIICKIWFIERLSLCLINFSMKTLVTLNLSIITTTFPGFLSYPSVYLSLAKYGREGGDPGKEVYYVLFINTKDFTEKKLSLCGFYCNKYYT